jgi:hypothetical protein
MIHAHPRNLSIQESKVYTKSVTHSFEWISGSINRLQDSLIGTRTGNSWLSWGEKLFPQTFCHCPGVFTKE